MSSKTVLVSMKSIYSREGANRSIVVSLYLESWVICYSISNYIELVDLEYLCVGRYEEESNWSKENSLGKMIVLSVGIKINWIGCNIDKDETNPIKNIK